MISEIAMAGPAGAAAGRSSTGGRSEAGPGPSGGRASTGGARSSASTGATEAAQPVASARNSVRAGQRNVRSAQGDGAVAIAESGRGHADRVQHAHVQVRDRLLRERDVPTG